MYGGSQETFNPKIRFLDLCRPLTDRQTDMKVNTEDTLSRFQEFFLNLSSRNGPTCKEVTCNEILTSSSQLILKTNDIKVYRQMDNSSPRYTNI